MRARYFVMAIVGGGAAWAATGQSHSHKAAIEFTKAALPPQGSLDVKAVRSASRLVLPIELASLARQADAELPDKLVTIKEWLPDAACGKRNLVTDCTAAKVEGTISRNGPVALQVTASTVKLSIPVKYALSAVGVGWANSLTDQKSGETVIDLAYTVTMNTFGSLDVARRDAPAADDASVALLRANIRLSRLVDPQLKAIAKSAEDNLKRTLAEVPVKAAIAHIWPIIAQPLELGKGSGVWLKTAPEAYNAGSLVSEGGKVAYQIPITSRLAMTESDKAPLSTNRQGATQSQASAPDGPSRVRVAIPVDLETMRQQAQAAFVNGQSFESRADRFSEPVMVKVRESRVYPAINQIGLQLAVDVTNSKGTTYAGTLHLAGRPVLDAATGTVTLADVTFPPTSGKGMDGQAPGLPRLGIEPFASKFAAAAKLDVSRPLADILQRGKQLLNQRLTDDVRLQAHLTETVPVSFELAKDGASLVVELVGDVAVIYEGAPDRIAAANSVVQTVASAAAPVAAVAAATALAVKSSSKARAIAERVAAPIKRVVTWKNKGEQTKRDQRRVVRSSAAQKG
jgi:Domain of unknown function (DUF4403)